MGQAVPQEAQKARVLEAMGEECADITDLVASLDPAYFGFQH